MRFALLVFWLATALAMPQEMVTFHTQPSGAEIYHPTQGRLGLTGQPIPLATPPEDGLRLQIKKDGFHPEEILFKDRDFRAHRYPDVGVLRLRPATPGAWVGLNWPWLALTLALSWVAVMLSLRRRADLRRARKLESLVAAAPSEGTMLLARIGQWRLVEQVGRGGMATVYRGLPAESLEVTEPVAIKVIQTQMAEQADFKARFAREIEVSKNLVHPNIVRLLEHGSQDAQLYLVQEFLDGGTLRQKLQLPISEQRMLEVMKPVFEAVAYAHGQGLIHRDLKPDNIMLTRTGRIVVTDFGLARKDDSENLTQTGAALGTPAYMAPEQIQGQLEQASDQYALGVICYELLAGQPPFVADDAVQLIFKHISDAPAPLHSPLNEPIMRMLAKNPADRFPSVKDALAALLRARP